jgi:hypothetical protein
MNRFINKPKERFKCIKKEEDSKFSMKSEFLFYNFKLTSKRWLI